jgi:mRNA interferase MazF
MAVPNRGEVWLVDLGLAAKVRPCLVLSVPPGAGDRALHTLVPHTTSLRGSAFEIASNVRFLKPGAFDAQGLVTITSARLLRRVGKLPEEEMSRVVVGVQTWLGMFSP